jgi:diguanylate cyclase (GGDEF)-like protein/PAS domain S-box-containing protein
MNNIRFLYFIVVTSLIAVIALSCFSVFFLSPSFTELVINNAESEAVKVGRFLSDSFQDEDKITRDLPSGFAEMVREAIADFGLMKIKVFTPEGETVYSTSEKDIGVINERDYFHNTVAKGKVFTKVVNKNTKSLEGQIVREDVVETYVPIMRESDFVGAFEVYYNITDNNNELDNLLFKSNGLLLLIAAGLLLAVIVISFIARRSFIKQELSEEKLNLLINLVPGIICTAGNDGYFKSVNPAMEKTLGFSKEELLSRPLLDFVHPSPDDRNPAKTESIGKTGGRRTRSFQNRYLHKDGSYRLLEWYTTSAVDGVLYAVAKDITRQRQAEVEREELIVKLQKALEEIKIYEAELKKMALFDPLTHLPNRRLFFDRLNMTLEHNRRNKGIFSVLYLDLDDFKKVNDSLGHQAGDELLCVVTERLKKALRKQDTLARIGGDEFMVIVDQLTSAKDAEKVAEKIIASLATSIQLKAGSVNVGVSIGISLFPSDSDEAEELVRMADQAMYKSKSQGKNTYLFYC